MWVVAVDRSSCSKMNEEINVENKTLISSEEINQKLSQLFGQDIAKAFEGKLLKVFSKDICQSCDRFVG